MFALAKMYVLARILGGVARWFHENAWWCHENARWFLGELIMMAHVCFARILVGAARKLPCFARILVDVARTLTGFTRILIVSRGCLLVSWKSWLMSRGRFAGFTRILLTRVFSEEEPTVVVRIISRGSSCCREKLFSHVEPSVVVRIFSLESYYGENNIFSWGTCLSLT